MGTSLYSMVRRHILSPCSEVLSFYQWISSLYKRSHLYQVSYPSLDKSSISRYRYYLAVYHRIFHYSSYSNMDPILLLSVSHWPTVADIVPVHLHLLPTSCRRNGNIYHLQSLSNHLQMKYFRLVLTFSSTSYISTVSVSSFHHSKARSISFCL